MRKAILGALAAVGMMAGFAGTAQADVDVDVYIGGVPYYERQIGPDYRFYPGRGWYLYRPYYRDRLSCNQARRLLRDRGYRRVSAIECNGRTYTFRAVRNDRRIILYVDSRTGRVRRA
jgi:hypothetical protein